MSADFNSICAAISISFPTANHSAITSSLSSAIYAAKLSTNIPTLNPANVRAIQSA